MGHDRAVERGRRMQAGKISGRICRRGRRPRSGGFEDAARRGASRRTRSFERVYKAPAPGNLSRLPVERPKRLKTPELAQ
jgi:hypothetical protein